MLCILLYLTCRNWGVRRLRYALPVSNENIDKIGRFYCFMGTIKGVLNYNEIGRNSRALQRKTGFDNPLENTKGM